MAAPPDASEVGDRAARALVALAYEIAGVFPHHGAAIKAELDGRIPTNERWRRVTAVLASLRALPGTALTAAEHGARNLATAHLEIPNQMAQATFGRGDEMALERASRWTGELEEELSR